MAQGKVKWFNERKGFGFIVASDGKELFCHYSDIEGTGFKSLKENDQVEFEEETSEKGLKAVAIKVI